MKRLGLVLLVGATLGGCAWIGFGATNAPGMPDCPAGRANCR